MDRILVSHRLPGGRVAELAACAATEVWPGPGLLPAPELRRRIADCHGLLCLLTDRIDGSVLDAAGALRFISSMSVGVDHIDLEAATARGIPVGHTPGVLVEATADATFGLLLAAARRLPEADGFLRAGRWRADNRWSPDFFTGAEVSGATLGVVGLGAIGQAVARRARAFAMTVVGWNRSPVQPEGVEMLALAEVLERADFLCLCVALTATTRDLIGAAEIGRMKPGAILVNTARGGIVDESALAEALHRGHLAAAAVDVFSEEPIDSANPLLSAPNTVLTPHLGSATRRTRARMADLAVENLMDALAGKPMRHCANPEVYER